MDRCTCRIFLIFISPAVRRRLVHMEYAAVTSFLVIGMAMMSIVGRVVEQDAAFDRRIRLHMVLFSNPFERILFFSFFCGLWRHRVKWVVRRSGVWSLTVRMRLYLSGEGGGLRPAGEGLVVAEEIHFRNVARQRKCYYSGALPPRGGHDYRHHGTQGPRGWYNSPAPVKISLLPRIWRPRAGMQAGAEWMRTGGAVWLQGACGCIVRGDILY